MYQQPGSYICPVCRKPQEAPGWCPRCRKARLVGIIIAVVLLLIPVGAFAACIYAMGGTH